MPGADFLPAREAELITWSANFSTKLNAGGVANYGLTLQQCQDYATLNTTFADAYAVANDPLTNSSANIVAKNDAKEALIDNARELAGIIQKNPATTDFQRSELGLTVPDEEPSPAPIPGIPGMEIVSAVGRTVVLKLKDRANPTSGGKPPKVDGAAVFSFVGASPPAPEDSHLWKFEGNTGKTTMTIQFPSSVPSGATAWFTAVWFNTRKESGDPAQPISAQIPGSLPMAA